MKLSDVVLEERARQKGRLGLDALQDDPETPVKKKDAGKPRLDLVPLSPLKLAAEAYGVGASKYAPGAWRENPMRWGQVQAALLRHLEAWWSRRELADPEDGQHHLGAVMFCVFTLAEYERLGIGEDDRP